MNCSWELHWRHLPTLWQSWEGHWVKHCCLRDGFQTTVWWNNNGCRSLSLMCSLNVSYSIGISAGDAIDCTAKPIDRTDAASVARMDMEFKFRTPGRFFFFFYLLFYLSLSHCFPFFTHTHTHTHTHTYIYIYISFSIFCFLWRWLKGELTSCLAEKFVFYFSAGSYAAATMVVDKLMWIGRLKRIRSEIISRELDALIGWWKWQSEVWNLDGFFCFVLFFLSFFLFLFLSPCRFHLKVINGVNFNAFTHLLNIESEFFGAWN